jgi:MFS family permease
MLGCSAIVFAGLGILNNCAGVFFKPVCDELGFSRARFSAYTSIQAVTVIFTLPLVGRVLPKVNLRAFLTTLVVVFCGAFMAMSQFHSLVSWYAAGLVMGLGTGSLVLLAAPVLVNNWFEDRAGLAMGIVMACSGLGGALFNPVGSLIIEQYGWRAAYLVLGGIALVVMLPFTLLVLRFRPSDIGREPYVTASRTVPVPRQGKGGCPQDVPGIPANVAFRSAPFAAMLTFVVGVAYFVSIQQHLPGFASSIGYSPHIGASVLSVCMIGMVVGKIGLGALNDRIGPFRTACSGIGVALLGLVLLAVGTRAAASLVAGAFMVGVGVALPTVQNPMLVRALFGQKEYSSIFSVVTMVLCVVGAVGVIAVGAVFDWTGSFVPAFVLAGAALCVAAIGVVISGRDPAKVAQAPTESR